MRGDDDHEQLPLSKGSMETSLFKSGGTIETSLCDGGNMGGTL